MNKVSQVLQRLAANGQKAFIPFLTAGDPDLETTAMLVRELSHRGASVVELGIPYSDPIADGPVIQASYTRALSAGTKLAAIFSTVSQLTKSGAELAPLVSMVAYSIVYRHGAERYVHDAKEAGLSGAIIPDLPVEEADEMAALAERNEFALIQLVTPTTPCDRAVKIAQASTGFLYYVSVTGITGERSEIASDLLQQVRWLKGQTGLPICIGFGISTPDHVRMLAPVADGVIVGSAIVRRIAEGTAHSRAVMVREIGDYASSLMAAL